MHIFDELAAREITSVDLGFARYSLRIMETLHVDEWAHTDTDAHEICLRCDLDDGPAREFLMHELTHCVLEVVGYTDSQGAAAANQALSLRRAEAVAAILKESGATGSIRTEGRGAADPVADNGTAEGRAKNRRVEITVR